MTSFQTLSANVLLLDVFRVRNNCEQQRLQFDNLNIPVINVCAYLILLIHASLNCFLLGHPFNIFRLPTSCSRYLYFLAWLETRSRWANSGLVGAKDILFPNVRTTLLASATDVIFISLTA